MPLFLMAEPTTDRITLSAQGDLQPGGSEVKVTLGIEGSRLYTGYEMDITLPEGIELNYYKGSPDVSIFKSSGSVYPYEEDRDENKTYTHTITTSYNAVAERTIRVSCFSASNQEFTAKSGKILTIYLKATPYAKPGAAELQLSNCKLAVWDEATMQTTGYVPVQTVIEGVSVGNNATVPVSVSSDAKWGTLMLPFATELPQGIEAYSCNSNDTQDLILKPEKSIEAFTPYIIYSENGFSENINGTVTDYPETDIVTQGYLRASVAQQTLTQGYVLQKQNGTVQFYKVNSEAPVTVKVGKCWVELPQQLASKSSFGITIDNATATKALTAAPNTTAAYHTISGVKVREPQKGSVYIHNGKKFTR